MLNLAKIPSIIRYGIYVSTIMPLVFTSKTMFPWHVGKTLLFQLLIQALVVLGAIYLFSKRDRIFTWGWLDATLVLFWILLLVSAFTGVDPVQSFWGNQSRMQGVFTLSHFFLVYFLARQFLDKKEHWLRLFQWIIGIGILSAVIAWIGPYIPAFDQIISADGRLSGMIGNPLFFGAYLLFPTMLAWAYPFIASSKKGHTWYYVVGIFLTITLLFAQIRGVFLGMAFGVLLGAILFLAIYKGAEYKKMRTWTTVGLLVLIVLGIGGMFIARSGQAVPLTRLFQISFSEGTVQTRLMAWDIVRQGVVERPVLGWGAETFQDVFDTYYNPDFLRFSFAETIWDKPHNTHLDVLISSGSIGFIVYLAVLVVAAGTMWRTIRQQKKQRETIGFIIIAAGLIAYLAQNSFGIDTSHTLFVWYLLLAYIAFQAQSVSQKTMPLAKGLFYTWVVLGVLWIALTPVWTVKTVQAYNGSVALGNARDLAAIGDIDAWQTQAQEVLTIQVPFIEEQAQFLTQDLILMQGLGILDRETMAHIGPQLERTYKSVIARYPDAYAPHFWLSEVYALMGEYVDTSYIEQSNDALQAAAERSPNRHRPPLLLAKNMLLAGNVDEAVDILEGLAAVHDVRELHWFLGLALMEQGEQARGLASLEKGQAFGLQSTNNVLYLIDRYAEAEAYEKIVPLYERLVRLEPHNTQYHTSLAATHAALGNTEDMIAAILEAVRIDPRLRTSARAFLQENDVDPSVFLP